jgi:TolB-like protein/Tfp pilus assembly protein PilF
VRLFDELKRRKVFRVGIAYLALAWLLIQIAETLLPAYGFSDAAIRTMVAGLAIGLVIALVLAWIFEWTPQGVRITDALDDAEDVQGSAPGQRAPNTVIALFVIIAAVLAAYLTFKSVEQEPVSERTIAVLPFSTLGQDQPDVFTDGMHVGVITRLSDVQDLDVISRTSVMSYRASELPMVEIASALGAAWVLRADVQQAGENVLVSVRLADGREDRQVWADDYQRTLTANNIFDIQADITHRIIEALEATITNDEELRVGIVPTENLEAYRLYRQGSDLVGQRTEDAMRRSLDFFERAIEADPDYGLAWAGLGNGLVTLVAYELEEDPEYLVRAEEAIDKALALDNDLAEAWAVRAMLNYLNRDGPATIRAINRAVNLRPGYAQAHTWRAFFHALFGDGVTSLIAASRAVHLDPLSPEAIINYGAASMANGNMETFLHEAKRAFEMAPDWPNTRFVMGTALYVNGQYREAAEMLEGLSVPWVGAGAETNLALSLLAMGEEQQARDLLSVIEASGDIYCFAAVRAALGEREAAWAMLDQINEWPDSATLDVRGWHRPIWNSQGDEARYARMLEKINESWGLPPEGLADN